MSLLDGYRRTGRAPTLTEKIQDETDPDVLAGMIDACGARGQILTDEENAAFAVRKIELKRGAAG